MKFMMRRWGETQKGAAPLTTESTHTPDWVNGPDHERYWKLLIRLSAVQQMLVGALRSLMSKYCIDNTWMLLGHKNYY